jgi:flagellar M-ring protein FliF
LDSLSSLWSTLDSRRRIIVIGATVAVFVAVLALARTTTSPDMSLLYANLDGSAAGDVITTLDQRGATYDVRGTSIFVPSAERDALRMTLASEGLPANTNQGYEILDNLSGFGTTSQMFDAAYWRAKEGELARTMLASPHIRAARVHISSPTGQPFRRDQKPTAAVTVTTTRGMLETTQAEALRFLVASSVPGMLPKDVAVIDGANGLVAGADDSATLGTDNERTEKIRARVERLLAARVGPGNAVVEVSLETVTETESITERLIDPESRIAISTEVQESTNKANDSRGGDVTVASNLPDGDAEAGGGNSMNEAAESRSVTNFEVSETQRELLRAPGAVRRLTVAVLVNAVETTNGSGEVQQVPRPEEELEDLRELVAAAVGFDSNRGDEITIRSMAFEPTAAQDDPLGTIEAPSTPLDMMRLIQTGVLAVVALVLGLFVVRPILVGRGAAARNEPLQLDNSGAAQPSDLPAQITADTALPVLAKPIRAKATQRPTPSTGSVT